MSRKEGEHEPSKYEAKCMVRGAGLTRAAGGP